MLTNRVNLLEILNPLFGDFELLYTYIRKTHSELLFQHEVYLQFPGRRICHAMLVCCVYFEDLNHRFSHIMYLFSERLLYPLLIKYQTHYLEEWWQTKRVQKQVLSLNTTLAFMFPDIPPLFFFFLLLCY